jgi:hypothetical protein
VGSRAVPRRVDQPARAQGEDRVGVAAPAPVVVPVPGVVADRAVAVREVPARVGARAPAAPRASVAVRSRAARRYESC